MDDTMPKLLRRNYQQWGDKVWMRKKEYGFWREYTWSEGYNEVKYFCLGLMALGFKRGDKLAILGDNDPHWFWAELAAHSAGGVVTGIFSSCSASEVKYIVEHCDATFIVAEDQEQVDKLLLVREELKAVKKIVYWNPDGLNQYNDPTLLSFDGVVDLGRQYETTHQGLFEESIEQGNGQELCFIMYTSGTTGLPKGGMMTYEGLIAAGEVFFSQFDFSEKDEWLSFILPGWMAEQGLGVNNSLMNGIRINCPEKPETVQENIREIAPSFLFYPSRLWEDTVSTIQTNMFESGFLRRILYHLCLPIGYKAADAKLKGEKLNLFWWSLYRLSKVIVFRPLLDKHGLSKLRYGLTGGALLGPDIFRFITAIGVNILQTYGASEQGVSMHSRGELKIDSVGRVNPHTIVRICDDYHILARGLASTTGYYKNPEATEKAFAGGWYHTGDAGFMDDEGHIYYLDRLEYMSELTDGTRFAPQYIESRLKFSPYIKDVFVVGDSSRTYIGAIVNIDLNNVGHWAERKKIPYTTFADLSQKPEVYRLVSEEVRKLNGRLPEEQRVKRFVNMPKEFDADEAELTRTMKLRRGFVSDRYKWLIEAIYGQEKIIPMEVEVIYQDGRVATVKADIEVVHL
ncbi:AMP-dependent synthetase/ligase [Chloroflexota bacterium]